MTNETVILITQWHCLVLTGALTEDEYTAIKRHILKESMGIEFPKVSSLPASDMLPADIETNSEVPPDGKRRKAERPVLTKTCTICGQAFQTKGPRATRCPACQKRPRSSSSDSSDSAVTVVPYVVPTPLPADGTVTECVRKDCIYRSKFGTCDYILKKRVPRGCLIENCDKYERRKA